MTDIIARANALLSDLQTGAEVDRGAIVAVLSDLVLDHADARRDILLQAARLRALESENATLQRQLTELRTQVIDALSSAGPAEDERSA